MVCPAPRRSSWRTRTRRSALSWSRKSPRRLTTSRVTAPPPPPFWLRPWFAKACATWPPALTRSASAVSRRPSRRSPRRS
uniref:Heat shock protein n=1 Tax=Mycobacterium aquiterrae TaxID=627680 RepID=A0A0X8XBK4_9MYCO|nr:heat shock protein [Mycobacterium aquiterrae]